MRKIAILGGVGYILIFITGIFANFGVLEGLRDPESVTQTFINFKSSQGALSLAIVAFLVMVLADLILTWVLKVLFENVDARLSQLTAWFRLVNVVIFAVALYHLLDVQYLIGLEISPDSPESVLALQVDRSLNAFSTTWLVGLVFFGGHLMLLAKLLFKETRIHKSIPSLLLIAGTGYIVDSLLQFTYSDYASISYISAFVVVLPGLIGELALTFWLLLKGGKNM